VKRSRIDTIVHNSAVDTSTLNKNNMPTYSHFTTGELARTLLCKAEELSDLELELLQRIEVIQEATFEMGAFRHKEPPGDDELEAFRDYHDEMMDWLDG
jgi:hypothetical protein